MRQRTEKPARPNLPRTSDDIRRVSRLLMEELLGWPGVTSRPMFGMRAFYRGRTVFAMLPERRAFGSPRAIAYMLGEKRKQFEIDSEQDLKGAMACLRKAYRQASALAARYRQLGT